MEGETLVREIIHDPIFLQRKSLNATAADLPIAEDLVDTLQANADRCVGLAANMIGKRKRIIAFCNGPLIMVMLNPKIINKDGEYETEEGCLSLDGVRKTKRYRSITVTWQDMDMNKRTGTLSGYAAQIVQHELDHCEGILI